MIRRRLSVALVAATGTALTLVAPAHAETLSGPVDTILAQSSGSSLSSTDDDYRDDSDSDSDSPLPGWAQSAEISDEGMAVIDLLRALLSFSMVAAEGAAIVLPFLPNGEQMLKDFLASVGVKA